VVNLPRTSLLIVAQLATQILRYELAAVGARIGRAARRREAMTVARTPSPSHVTSSALNPHAPVDGYPLSPVQREMFFHWLLDRHSGTDIEQIVGDLHEHIDPDRMERAWQHVLDTFGALRTSFAWETLSVPLQRVEPHATLALTVEDLRSLASHERAHRVGEFLESDRHEGFDLSHAPLMRVKLFRLADAHVRIVWTFHHILSDRQAFEIILNEAFASYAGETTGAAADRPYREYIEWVGRQVPEAARRFWRAKLEGFTAPTPIPADHPPSPGREQFGQRRVRLSAEISGRLREMVARDRLSLNTVILSAWALLLARYSGESDVVFGATKTTRRGTIPDAESMVGLFLATIPVRIKVDHDQSVAELLKQVRAEWISLRGFEHLPLVDIRQVTEVPASEPMFESLVVYEDQQFGARLNAQGGPWANRHFSILAQPNVPLTLLVHGDDSLMLQLEYDTRRFESATIDRMSGHLETILASWSQDTSGPLWRTPMLTVGERKTILEEWNDTAREYPRDVPLAELVETQVARTPDAPAVTSGSETVSYRELNARANRLARELRRHGAGPDVPVGLAVERSIEMMVALLAVIKAGAGYVPLDPMFPRDRLAYMMEDSELRVLVTQSRVRSSLPEFGGVVLDLDAPTWDGNDASDLAVAVAPEALAVVIFTSGSTGRPKGVQISRGALLNLLWSMREWLALTASDRLLAVTTISFDIAGADIWLPWLVGAHIVVASRVAAADGAQLRGLIERHDVTFLQATPVTWRQLLAEGWTGKADLQAVCTGEAMPPEVAAGVAPLVGRLWNLYGPTETTIWSTGVAVREAAERISIGKPVANTQCYILDEHRQPVPIGVPGELYIAGDGVAIGYLKRPDLDTEKFLADPFSTRPGARMYRTGDQARYLADGTIECLGRTDHQVKIRGFRVELGEVESVLRSYPGVRQTVVVAREDTPGERRLVAYVVPERAPLAPAEMRAHLKTSLPDYMVPSVIVNLEAMPMTANGKIDRRALPVPGLDAVARSAATVSARTHVEKQLGEIWEEIFDRPQIGMTANFFDLGGHSTLAVRMMARITRVFGKQLSLNALLESPTIAQLAKHVEDAGRALGRHTLVSIQAAGSRPPIFWIPGGAALGLFRLRNIVTQLGPEQPVYGLGSTHPETLADVESVEQRSRMYLELVRRVRPHGPYCFAGFCAGGLVAYEMAQQASADGEAVVFVGMIDSSFPRYPARRLDRMLVKAQRLRYQIGAARERSLSLVGYAREKLAARRETRAERLALAAVAREVKESGFRQDASAHSQVLLRTTDEVFERYEPRPYAGAISLFVSDDEAFHGVSRRLDPRFHWIQHVAAHEVRSFPGGHGNVFDARDAGSFAEALQLALEKALGQLVSWRT